MRLLYIRIRRTGATPNRAATRSTAGGDADWPPLADGLSVSYAGLEVGDAGLAVAGVGTDVGRLDLSGSGLRNIAALARLRAHDSLDLSNNASADVSSQRGLTELRQFDLVGNDIADGWPLAELPKLEVLVLDDNGVAEAVDRRWRIAGRRGDVRTGGEGEPVEVET